MKAPSYAYVPGRRPHPTRHPEGHSYGRSSPPPQPLDPARWQACGAFVLGLWLFERGYYWEAHEAWEGPFRVAERTSAERALLRGLILLAAAGVKVRQARASRAAALAERALGCFADARERSGAAVLAGLDLERLSDFARYARQQASTLPTDPDAEVEVVFKLPLRAG